MELDRVDRDGVSMAKRKHLDPKERVKASDSDVVLSPQRMSFGKGCHAITKAGLTDDSETSSMEVWR